MNTQDFIKKAKVIHGNKYDYSLVNYVNSNTKVIIICPVHGEFLQRASAHLSRRGCMDCYSNSLKSNLNSFIEKAKAKHGDKYDYSLVNYVNNVTKITIICPIHGEFLQTPNSHLLGCGCRKCSYLNKIIQNCKSTTSEFIEKAKAKHGDKYDYSLVEYVNHKTKVTIICPVHGEFKQNPSSHLNGSGCSDCYSDSRALSLSGFIEKAKSKHGDKYDYSLVNYVNNVTKVTIICPIHGEFEQQPSSHLNRCGCMDCGYESRNTK